MVCEKIVHPGLLVIKPWTINYDKFRMALKSVLVTGDLT